MDLLANSYKRPDLLDKGIQTDNVINSNTEKEIMYNQSSFNDMKKETEEIQSFCTNQQRIENERFSTKRDLLEMRICANGKSRTVEYNNEITTETFPKASLMMHGALKTTTNNGVKAKLISGSTDGKLGDTEYAIDASFNKMLPQANQKKSHEVSPSPVLTRIKALREDSNSSFVISKSKPNYDLKFRLPQQGKRPAKKTKGKENVNSSISPKMVKSSSEDDSLFQKEKRKALEQCSDSVEERASKKHKPDYIKSFPTSTVANNVSSATSLESKPKKSKCNRLKQKSSASKESKRELSPGSAATLKSMLAKLESRKRNAKTNNNYI